MSGKYDPADKAQLLADNPRIDSTVELMVATAAAQFPKKVKTDDDASRASSGDALETAQPQPKRGRKPVVTPERTQTICELLARGESERSGCMRAGIGLTAWNAAKRADAHLRERIACARDDWARLRHRQHAAALYESQSARAAARKALKPQPTHQAKLVMWHLISRVPLHFAAIPDEEIQKACEKFSISIETWRRQERVFGLLKKVYAKRAAIRGQEPPSAIWPSQQFHDWPSEDAEYCP